MTKNHAVPVLTVLLLSVLAGCSGRVDIRGKVTFPDGTPVPCGQILFEKEGFVASGEIQSDGTYRLGTFKKGDGIPPGEYKVYFCGVLKQKRVENRMPGSKKAMSMGIPIPLLAAKYDSAGTSDLKCVVGKSAAHDFQVEPR